MSAQKEAHAKQLLCIPRAVLPYVLISPIEPLTGHFALIDDLLPFKAQLRTDPLKDLIIERVPIESEPFDRVAKVQECHLVEASEFLSFKKHFLRIG